MPDLLDELWASDEASALTNRAAREIERLQAAADANICCPDCGFTGPAKDWEMSVSAPASKGEA